MIEYPYTAKCMGCGSDFVNDSGDELRARSIQEIVDMLIENGWKRQGKKWFCPDCQKGRK